MQRKCLRKIASSDIYTLHIHSWNEISAVVEQQHQQNSLSLIAVTLQALFKHMQRISCPCYIFSSKLHAYIIFKYLFLQQILGK